MAVLAYDPTHLGTGLSVAQLLWENAANCYLISATTSWRTALSNVSQTTGKWYFESTDGGAQFLVGIGNISTALNDFLGDDANSCAFQDSGSVINIGGTTGWTGCKEGDRIGVAVDAGAKKIWVRINGGAWLSGDPVAGTGGGTYTVSGAVFPANSLNASGGHLNTSADISGSSHSFSAAVPSGYTQWGDASSYATPTQTFDTVRKDSSVTLSLGNLKSTFGNNGDFCTEAASLLIQSSGSDTYFEMTVNTTDSATGVVVGMVCPLAPINGSAGYQTNTAGVMYDNAGNVWLAGASQTAEATYTTGDVIGVAISPSIAKLWMRKNGGSWFGGVSPNPTTHSGGFDVSPIMAHQKAMLPACVGFHVPALTMTAIPPFAFASPFGAATPKGSFFHSPFGLRAPGLAAAAGLELIRRNPLVTRRGLILPSNVLR